MTSSDESSGNPRRGEEITSAILSAADKAGITRMGVMSQVFLTYDIATAYIERLAQEGLLEYRPGTGKYVTTEQGKRRLRNDSAG